MKNAMYLILALALCMNASAQVAKTSSAKNDGSVEARQKAKPTAELVGKSKGSITHGELANASKLEMSDGSTPSSFTFTLSCSGAIPITCENSKNNELTAEMKAICSRSSAGCLIIFSDIKVNGKSVSPLSLTVN